jgi:hypothetical protein
MTRLRRNLPVLAAVGAIAGAGAASASAITVQTIPATPKVEQGITAVFHPSKALPAGWHYDAMVIVETAQPKGCASLASATSRSRASRVVIALSPGRPTGNGGKTWCKGKATVLVTSEPNGAPSAKDVFLVGIRHFTLG